MVLSEHPYLYCEHEPVNRLDPSGRLLGEILAALIVVALVTIIVHEALSTAQTHRRHTTRPNCNRGTHYQGTATVMGSQITLTRHRGLTAEHMFLTEGE